MSPNPRAEYIFVGGGPASLCGIPAVLKTGVPGKQIIWIDQGGFKAGDFGSLLSQGSSVPGNTTVESYQKVNQAIYDILPECRPSKKFSIDSLPPEDVCPLNIAAEPMRHLSEQLRQRVHAIEGRVTDIVETAEGLALTVSLAHGEIKRFLTKRCILAIGAQPKQLLLPPSLASLTLIDPNIAFIRTALANYLHNHPQLTTVAVIGSSHSAALAVMHLLEAGLNVKQFMNKAYKFATRALAPDGTAYTQFDNTGLKGQVAAYTKKLLAEQAITLNHPYQFHIENDRSRLQQALEEQLKDYTHAVAAIGYETTPSLKINAQLVSAMVHDKKTTALKGVKGLFGLGIAFPQEITSISGEVEASVGYAKFWHTVNDPVVVDTWEKSI